MKEISLVVLAAGMGNRFGGLKQLTGVGPSGETLLEYGVYDAWRAGIRKVVFIIRKSFEAEFREQVVARFPGELEVVCVFQQIDDLPGGHVPPEGRTKPWGTGHAVLSARHVVDGPFIVINGDDFYGSTAYLALVDFLDGGTSDANGLRFALGGYRLRNTLSHHGTVSRGVCEVNVAGFLQSIKEHRRLGWDKEGTAVYSAEEGIDFTGEELVSLNLFGLQGEMFPGMSVDFGAFLAANEGSLDAEFFLPDTVSRLVHKAKATLRVLPTEESWFGMTYAKERVKVEAAIQERIRDGIYPKTLW